MKKKNQGYKRNLNYILAAFLCIFPWIMHFDIVKYNKAETEVFSSYNGYGIDIFIQIKEKLVIGLAIFLICWFVGERIFPYKVDNNVPLIKGKNKMLYGMLGIYALMVIISTIFSANKKNALWGSPTEGEGMLVLLSYAVIILAFYNYFATKDGIAIIKKAIFIVSIVTVVLTCIEYFYKPILEIGFVQSIISTSENKEIIASLKASDFSGAVSLMFYNPSYYGGFVCMLIPFGLWGCFEAKRITDKVTDCLIFMGLVFGVLVSHSTTALYIALFECVFTIIVYLIKSKANKDAIISCSYLVCGVFAVIMLYSLISDKGIFDLITNANSATGEVVEERFDIESIELESNSIFIMGKENGIRISYMDKQIKCMNENSVAIPTKYEEGIMTFESDAYKNISIGIVANSDKTSEIEAKLSIEAGYDDTIDFYILSDGTLSGVGQNNSILRDISGGDVPDGLKKYYGVFTGRGYAWINSMPMVKKSLLKGVGPGNFAYYFKQQDYVGMLHTHGSVKYVIDKPHNSYIQYSINIGMLGMLSFFGVFVYAFVKGVKRLKNMKSLSMQEDGIYISCLVSICGFLVYSVINDSIITVTPIMCMILGITLATGYLLEKGE